MTHSAGAKEKHSMKTAREFKQNIWADTWDELYHKYRECIDVLESREAEVRNLEQRITTLKHQVSERDRRIASKDTIARFEVGDRVKHCARPDVGRVFSVGSKYIVVRFADADLACHPKNLTPVPEPFPVGTGVIVNLFGRPVPGIVHRAPTEGGLYTIDIPSTGKRILRPANEIKPDPACVPGKRVRVLPGNHEFAGRKGKIIGRDGALFRVSIDSTSTQHGAWASFQLHEIEGLQPEREVAPTFYQCRCAVKPLDPFPKTQDDRDD